MKLFILLLVSSIGFSNHVNAQVITGTYGAEPPIYGGVSVLHNAYWSLVNNPANMVLNHVVIGSLFSERHFNMPELGLNAIAFQAPVKHLFLGAMIAQYGQSPFTQSRLGISAATKLSTKYSIGIHLSYLITTIKEYGSKAVPLTSIGFQGKLNSHLTIGVCISNPIIQHLTNNKSDDINGTIKVGLGYEVNPNVMILSQMNQDGYGIHYCGGLKYTYQPGANFGIGIGSSPFYYSFGTQLKWHAISMEFSSTIHEILGFTPHVGINYQLTGKQ